MSKLPKKLKRLKIERNIKSKEIVAAVSKYCDSPITSQAVSNWLSEKRCPKKLKYDNAVALVLYSRNFITMKDCGYEA